MENIPRIIHYCWFGACYELVQSCEDRTEYEVFLQSDSSIAAGLIGGVGRRCFISATYEKTLITSLLKRRGESLC